MEAFDYNVTDFLVKPVDFSRFVKAVNKAVEMHENVAGNVSRSQIFIKKDSVLIKVEAKEIYLISTKALPIAIDNAFAL